MSRLQYDVKESYTGTGSLDTYSFDFKITQLEQLLVVALDDNGVEIERVRGDDTSFLDSVTFDSKDGGGEVVLQANLPTDYTLIILLADDEPTQDYLFRDKTSFNLRRFEDALDNALGAIQRLAYRAARSFQLHEADDEAAFNIILPPGIADQADRGIFVNSAGNGLTYGSTVTEISNAETFALAAQAAQAAAEAAQQAAEDAAASIMPSNFIEFNGPISGTLQRSEVGILESGVAFLLTLGNTGLLVGDTIQMKILGFNGILTVQGTAGATVEGVAAKALNAGGNASFTFRYTGIVGTEWIIT